MEFKYLVSDNLNYAKLICDDAGPRFAASMRWDWSKISENCDFDSKTVYIIDNRISERECGVMASIVSEHSQTRFLFKVVDPYYENREHYYYITLNSILHLKNVFLYTVYEPCELTASLSRSFINKLIYIPYPYDPFKELPLEALSSRKNQILISGSINPSIYPYRSRIWFKTRRTFARVFFPVLRHPGYAEVSNTDFRHEIVGDSYVRYLSKYKAMLLCSTRSRIELLKFYECAYSGCLPIGEAPDTFPKEVRDLIYYVDTNSIFLSSFKFFISWKQDQHLKKLEAYRNFFRKERNVEYLNYLLKKQLSIESAVHTS